MKNIADEKIIYARIKIVLENENIYMFKNIINLKITDDSLFFIYENEFYYFNINKIIYYSLIFKDENK